MLYFMTYLWASFVFIPFVIFFTLNTIVTLKKLSKAMSKNISNLLVVIYTYIRTAYIFCIDFTGSNKIKVIQDERDFGYVNVILGHNLTALQYL